MMKMNDEELNVTDRERERWQSFLRFLDDFTTCLALCTAATVAAGLAFAAIVIPWIMSR